MRQDVQHGSPGHVGKPAGVVMKRQNFIQTSGYHEDCAFVENGSRTHNGFHGPPCAVDGCEKLTPVAVPPALICTHHSAETWAREAMPLAPHPLLPGSFITTHVLPDR